MSTYSLNPNRVPLPLRTRRKASMEEEKQEKQGKQESKCDKVSTPLTFQKKLTKGEV
jgi:hypothetical protein